MNYQKRAKMFTELKRVSTKKGNSIGFVLNVMSIYCIFCRIRT